MGGTDVILSWLPGADDTTPTNYQSFAVRVGTTQGGVEIVNPNAISDGSDLDGFRMTSGIGNAGHNTYLRLRNLSPSETYFW